ncbi:Hypothetical_protein [Hexamita inflata]|uniref:Hypothetical_protein n=1 Tax=Hexamita inflata TaxID=28002 RepID=A0AA86TXZ6_9EUKA|nr:Hypothetical protein HINF_LOCUS4769 [Hexamita inflata]CAI9932576.1 Hypothetical protein HINF_LOCUS20221 [Hexamita inflata]CAI9967054.1 Hypothetical protein HINF_LOCUS54699 [Hexamita inflata]
MESIIRQAYNQQLKLRETVLDTNLNLDKIQQNKIKIADLMHKNVLLLAEKQLLQMKLDQYDGNFNDCNSQLKKELQHRVELLDLLKREKELLLKEESADEEQELLNLVEEVM